MIFFQELFAQRVQKIKLNLDLQIRIVADWSAFWAKFRTKLKLLKRVRQNG